MIDIGLPSFERLIRCAGLACLGLAVMWPAATGATTGLLPKNFTAKYEASFKGVPITAVRSLKTLDNGLQELRFSADSWLANIDEFSHFRWNEQGQVVPKNYEYHREGLGRDRHAILSFNWEDKRVVNNVQNKPWTMDLPAEALDKLSYQIQLRRDLLNNKQSGRYIVADGGKIKHYLFEVVGEEVLQTPVGRLHTIKVKRVREKSNKRITHLWLAKDWNLLVVRISQQEKDGKPYEIILAKAKIDGEAVKGF
ncbi:DUF3108 domain-containing protein [Exilibacterium tricleocarpae]|uniref:DUF3108 domain-containing protein n=1 Tax=Exilibacterium tricleocarpae TaxID=2591008 RepID=A0A545UBF8_9GAMM|nr:DUF3108 domain-containing protein [Exilibacterium tricleocarpae]TQV86800.1 DUF3108 domain-containing protein [Exilibacterium tricleocarpae]